MEEMNLMPTLAEASPPRVDQQIPPELDEGSPVERIKAADQARDGFPGEHWLVLALGIALWQYTRKDRRWYVRTIGGFGATALVARAAAGREGLSRVLSYTPLGRSISRCPPCDENAQARR